MEQIGEAPKTPQICCKFTLVPSPFNKGEEFLQQMVLSQVDTHMQKNETDHYPQTIFKY